MCILVGIAAVATVGTFLGAPWLWLLLAVGVVFTLSFLENEAFLLTLIFLQPIDVVSSSIPLVSDTSLALHGLAVAGFFLGRLHRRERAFGPLWQHAGTRTSSLFVASIAFAALCGLPGLAHEKIRGLYFVTVYFGFYLFLASWLVSEQRRRAALRALLWSTIVVSAFAVVQTLSRSYTPLYALLYEMDSTEWQHRPPSFLPGPNALAGYLNVLLPFAIAVCFLKKDKDRDRDKTKDKEDKREQNDRALKRLSAAATAAAVLALVLSQSRGGYLAFATTIVLAIWYFGRTAKRRIAGLLALALVGTASYASLLAWNPTHFGAVEEDQSALSRIILWYTAWNLFLSSPVHGIGFGTFNVVSDRYLPVVVDMPEGLGVHNIYLELLAETGVLGLLSFLAVAVGGIARARRQSDSALWFQRVTGFGSGAGMVAMLVAGLVDHNVLWAPQIGLSFWFCLAMAEAAPPSVQTQQQPAGGKSGRKVRSTAPFSPELEGAH